MLAAVIGCHRSADPAPLPPAAPDPLTMMRDAMSAGDWELARQHSQQALVAHPDDPDVMLIEYSAGQPEGIIHGAEDPGVMRIEN